MSTNETQLKPILVAESVSVTTASSPVTFVAGSCSPCSQARSHSHT
jgi:hypothetical protein